MTMKHASLPQRREDLNCGRCKKGTFSPFLAVTTSCHLSPDPDSSPDGNCREGPSACSGDVQAHGGLGKGGAAWGPRRASWAGEGRCPRGRRQLRADWDILMNHLLDKGFLSSITVTSWEQQHA